MSPLAFVTLCHVFLRIRGCSEDNFCHTVSHYVTVCHGFLKKIGRTDDNFYLITYARTRVRAE